MLRKDCENLRRRLVENLEWIQGRNRQGSCRKIRFAVPWSEILQPHHLIPGWSVLNIYYLFKRKINIVKLRFLILAIRYGNLSTAASPHQTKPSYPTTNGTTAESLEATRLRSVSLNEHGSESKKQQTPEDQQLPIPMAEPIAGHTAEHFWPRNGIEHR